MVTKIQVDTGIVAAAVAAAADNDGVDATESESYGCDITGDNL